MTEEFSVLDLDELYFSGMNNQQITDRFSDIDKRLSSLPAHRRTWWEWALFIVPTLVSIAAIAIPLLRDDASKAQQHEQGDLSAQIDRQIDTKLRPLETKINETEKQASIVAAQVKGLESQMTQALEFLKVLAENRVKKAASDEPQQFAATLPEVKSALDVAKRYDVVVGREVIEAIRARLLGVSPQAQGYWKTVGLVVGARSTKLPATLPPCYPLHLYKPDMETVEKGKLKTIKGGLEKIVVQKCYAELDNQGVGRMQFKNVRIIYRGGPVTFGPNVTFIDCEFDIEIAPNTPSDGKRFAQQLLATASIESLTMN